MIMSSGSSSWLLLTDLNNQNAISGCSFRAPRFLENYGEPTVTMRLLTNLTVYNAMIMTGTMTLSYYYIAEMSAK